MEKLREVEGLRALAVLGVLLYHLGVRPFGGGYLGVDVFFAVSGFVITLLLRKELAQSPRLDYRAFLRRRAARLLPAYFVTVVLTLAAGIILLSPGATVDLARTALAASFGVPNVLFWLSSGYFDPASYSRPLLHLWSLGVEMQFYLVWPFAVVLLHWSRQPLIWLVALFGVTVALVWLFSAEANLVFYLTPFRAFEFIAGSVAVLLRERLPPMRPIVADGLAVAAVAVLVASLASVPPASTGAPWLALPAILSTATLLVLVGQSRLSGALLGNPVAVWLGGMSYSLYLVHWPIIVLSTYAVASPVLPVEGKLAAAVATFLLAVALHYLIEQRYRTRRSAAPAAYLAGLTAAVVLALGLWATQGLPQRVPTYSPAIASTGCAYPQCSIPAGATSVDVVIFGDSHAPALAPGLIELSERTGLTFEIFHFDGGCRLINLPENNTIRSYDCPARLQSALDFLARSEAKSVIFAFRWTQADTRMAAERIAKLVQSEEFSSVENKAFILSVPEMASGLQPERCMAPILLVALPSPCSEWGPRPGPATAANEALLNSDALTGFTFFDPFAALCDQARCRQRSGATWLYSDDNHLSALGAEMVVDAIGDRLAQWSVGGPR